MLLSTTSSSNLFLFIDRLELRLSCSDIVGIGVNRGAGGLSFGTGGEVINGADVGGGGEESSTGDISVWVSDSIMMTLAVNIK